MRWDALAADADRVGLARALVEATAQRGWSKRALRQASQNVAGEPEFWRSVFPSGSRDAIWFISEVSDASMKAAFDTVPAEGMSDVIAERLAQNADLKPFVRHVMFFDLLHPVQALARMQRTARVMIQCVEPERQHVSGAAITALNLGYTFIVFVWLLDSSRTQAMTRRTTVGVMRLLGL
jgi:hypothetical protein